MRLLHTADWHLGKHLEGQSRLKEQEDFIDELVEIADEHNVELILVSGDIYDTFNPPAEAEKLFFRAMKDLSRDGKRVIIIVSGNHDSPDRLMASYPLAYNQGIIILGTPQSSVVPGRIGKHEIVEGGRGFLELAINGKRVVILTLPFPSEKRLNQVLSESSEERELQQKYSVKIGEIFSELESKFRDDTINIAISHLFVAGGDTCKSERPIHVGGGLTVHSEHLPERSQYTALGHLHRCQTASKVRNAYYAGSPLQYSVSEIGYSKCVLLVDLEPGNEPVIEEIKLRNRKPIEVWEVDGIENALKKCKENSGRPVWAYLRIKTDRTLLQTEIKEIKKIKPDILSIIPVISGETEEDEEVAGFEEKDIIELFQEFYKKTKEVEPDEEVLRMFALIVNGKDVQE